jgi:Tol biopolymer transport system component
MMRDVQRNIPPTSRQRRTSNLRPATKAGPPEDASMIRSAAIRRLRIGLRLGAALALALANMTLVATVRATTPGQDGLVAFSRGESSDVSFRAALYTMNPDGSNVRQLTTPDWGFGDGDSSWSPDGTKLAFQRDDFAAGNSDLYVINADGSGLLRLTNCSAEPHSTTCGGYFGPVWTPDGRSLVLTRCCVTRSDGVHQTIDIIGADGTGLRALTYDPNPNGGDEAPTISPDGQWVAFSRVIASRPGQVTGIAMFLVRTDGSGLHQITPSNLWVDEKDWSPDGSRIVFTSHAGSNGKAFRADIDTIAPDGTHLTTLTSTTPGQSFAFAPVWSPAGDRIMFHGFPSEDGSTHLFTMRPDGADVQEIPGTGGVGPISWGTAPTR